MKVRHRYSERVRSRIAFPETGRTKQSFRDESDINRIISKYNSTGQLPALIRRDGRFGDFSDVRDYQESLDIVYRAQAAFDALPAQVRAECGNDPAVFLEKVQDRDWALRHKLALDPASGLESPARGAQEPPKGGAATQPGGDEPVKPARSKAKASTTADE